MLQFNRHTKPLLNTNIINFVQNKCAKSNLIQINVIHIKIAYGRKSYGEIQLKTPSLLVYMVYYEGGCDFQGGVRFARKSRAGGLLFTGCMTSCCYTDIPSYG